MGRKAKALTAETQRAQRRARLQEPRIVEWLRLAKDWCRARHAVPLRTTTNNGKIALRYGQEGVDEFGGEGFQLGGAFGAGLELVLFADEPVAIGLDRASA